MSKTYEQQVAYTLLKDLAPDTIGYKKNGNILCRWSYFYRNNTTAEDYVQKVIQKLSKHNVEFNIINSGDTWKAFKGGASVANQSHFFVEVSIN